jgi:hypothetical protein
MARGPQVGRLLPRRDSAISQQGQAHRETGTDCGGPKRKVDDAVNEDRTGSD